MARGINKVILVGNVGKDPEMRFTQGGASVTSFSVATSESWKDKQDQMQERTEWHNLVCFNRLAEIANDYLKKGAKVYIEGSLRTSSWEQDNITRYRTEIIVSDLQMLDRKSDGMSAANDSGSSMSKPEPMSVSVDDDIPF